MFDALTLAAIAEELRNELTGGRIQRVLHIDRLTLGIEIYARHRRRWLILSADSQQGRILLAETRAGGDPEQISSLLQLMRKWIRGGRITSITQPEHERLIRFTISKPDPESATAPSEDTARQHLDIVENDLIIELMGRRSNIILCSADGAIRDSIKRVTSKMSRVRPILPGMKYEPPPPQHKLDPLSISPKVILELVANEMTPLARWLVQNWLSISPQLARELIYRADLDAVEVPSELCKSGAVAIANAFQDLFSPLTTGRWQPCYYQFDDGKADFSAVQLKHLANLLDVHETTCSVVLAAANLAWEQGSVAGTATGDRHATRRKRLLDEIDNDIDRVENRISSLEEQQHIGMQAEKLKLSGELIYTYISMIEPGQSELITPDKITIQLDPTLTPSENAQAFFDRYRKAQSATETLPKLIDNTQRQLAYLEQLKTHVSQAESYEEIESVRLEWLAYAEISKSKNVQRPKGSKPSKQANRPKRYRTKTGDLILVGRTGPQNELVTFEDAGPNDFWLHARDMPGSHVIIKSAVDEPDESIELAASLAAYYSQGRGSTTVPVDVTRRRHVRKIKGSGPGLVRYQNEYTLQVQPKSEVALGLQAE